MEPIEIPVGEMTFSAHAAGPSSGRLVLLLHGFPQSSAEWRHLVPALAEAGYRAIAPDQRGYSDGARPEGVKHYRLDHLVADVVAIADELGGHRFDLIGHDWGAVVAWAVAARYPERVRTLTAVSVPHPAAFAEALAASAEQKARSAYVAFFRTPKVPEAALLAAGGAALRQLLTRSGLPEADAEQHVAFHRRPGVLEGALNWYRAVDPGQLAAVGPVEAPTLFVWSTDDPSMSRSAAERAAGHVRGPYRFEVLDGVSHWVPEAVPDLLRGLVLEHLASVQDA